MPSRTNIQPTTVRLSDEGKRLLALLAADMGVNRSAVIEILIRAEAERKGLR
jgi:predicted transcriptional regulator